MTAHKPRTVVLDSQGVIAACRNEQQIREQLAAARNNAQRIVVPAVVLTEIMTGGPCDARIRHVVRRFTGADLTATLASKAGALRERASDLRRKKHDLTVDAIVAATAIDHVPATVLTADVDDLRLLTSEHDVKVMSV